MDKEASTSGVRVYFTIPFVTPSLGGIMIFLFPDSKSKANADWNWWGWKVFWELSLPGWY